MRDLPHNCIVGGGASLISVCSSTSITLLARVLYPCISVYLITGIVYLCILHTHHYDVMVGWLVHRSRQKGVCVGKKVNCGPIHHSIHYYNRPYTCTCAVLCMARQHLVRGARCVHVVSWTWLINISQKHLHKCHGAGRIWCDLRVCMIRLQSRCPKHET